MKASWIVALSLFGWLGCNAGKVWQFDEALIPNTDLQRCPAPPDMTPPLAACPAARGLTGNPIFCADFANPQTTLAALTGLGWKFDAVASGNCGGWQIINNLLQVNNFAMLNGTCALTLPITMGQIQTYKRLTLSIQHRLDLSDPEQQAQIFLDNSTPNTRVMWQATGKRDVPRQQTVITIDSAELPTALNGGFKWFFQVSSPGAFARNGWQIESIAVMGNP